MSLATIEASHIRVTCDRCGVTAEVCGRRDLPVMARVASVKKFLSIGWHQDRPASAPRRTISARADKESAEMGNGKWYCPGCARQTHL
jgi:hypothetical protein